MKYHIFRFLLFLFVGFIVAGCNKRDLDRLEDIAEDHAVRLARLEKMIIEAEQQIMLINKLLVEYDGRLMVLGMKQQDNGEYRIFFSDGDTAVVNGGKTPMISLSPENTWIINGTDTGIKAVGENVAGDGIAPQIRQENGNWQISEDGGVTWKDSGVKVKGEDGTDGHIPLITVGVDGNWYIDGRDTGIPLHGKDGESPGAPQVKVLDNGNWGVKNGDSDWKDTGVPAEGKDGESGVDGKGTPYITGVSVSGTKVSFIFSDNIPGTSPATNVMTVTRQVDFSYTILEDGKWVTLPSKPMAIPIGGMREIEFKITLPVGEEVSMRSIVLPDGFVFMGEERVGSSGTLSEKIKIGVDISVGEYRFGLVFFNIIGISGKNYTTLIPVATLLYRLDVSGFNFPDSYVYRVLNKAGERVAEICWEHIQDGTPEGKIATVIYPYDAKTMKYGVGFVTGIGGIVDPATARYEPSVLYPPGKNHVYFLSSASFMTEIDNSIQATPLSKEGFVPDKMVDVSGNSYKIVKIGTQYWMAENLKTEVYNDGNPIPLLAANAAWGKSNSGACCYYANKATNKNEYGLLYNAFAVTSGLLAPAGWHVPDTEEWRLLETFLGMPGNIADQEGWRGTAEGNKLKGGPDVSVTCFGAEAAGKRSESGVFEGVGINGSWWAVNGKDNKIVFRGLETGKTGIFSSFADKKQGNSVRCVRNVFVECK